MEEAIADPGYILYKQFCRFSCVQIYILAQIFLLSLKIIEAANTFDSPFFFVLKEFLLAPSNNASVI